LKIYLPDNEKVRYIKDARFTIYRTNGTSSFAPTHKAHPLAKPKEPFFSQRTNKNGNFEYNIN
jgi:hypothetical protein